MIFSHVLRKFGEVGKTGQKNFFPLFTEIRGKGVLFLTFYGKLGEYRTFSHILRKFREGLKKTFSHVLRLFRGNRGLFLTFYGKAGKGFDFFPLFTEIRGSLPSLTLSLVADYN